MIETYERSYVNIKDWDKACEVFTEGYENGKETALTGTVASYIPELSKADRSDFGICVHCADGKSFEMGEVEKRFTMQSISKVVNLALALNYYGFEKTFSHVLLEPTGDSFNSIIKLDTVNPLPFNPMINAGAIQILSMLSNDFVFDELLDFARKFCMDDGVTLNEEVYHSEAETGDRNRAITYLLKSKGVLQGDPDATLELYFRMCSLNVNARSLANLSMILANKGRNPVNGKYLLHPDHVRTIKSLMSSCGMYDESGSYSVLAGIPSKSGVGGGITGVVSSCAMGIGTFGPALNDKGNSSGGIAAITHISRRLKLNIFE